MTTSGLNSGLGSSVASSLPVLTSQPSSLISLTSSISVTTLIPSSTNGLATTTGTARIPYSVSISGSVYAYVGCIEGQYIQPIVSQFTVGDVDECARLCVGTKYFTLEGGDQCTCGNAVVSNPTIGADSSCGVHCVDNSNEFCGGLKLLRRQQLKYLAAYSSIIATASTTQAFGVTIPTLRPSFSSYANTSSKSVTSSQTRSPTSPLPYGCTDISCVSASDAGRSAASASSAAAASTSSLPYGCDSMLISQTSSSMTC